ncbi:histidinol-phosphate transaminase [Thioalkalivibrio sp. XN8]|uniref:histidinol-phosphate transaminase n=1 Tax=Thioalkalivibrio sp. XN8 TaxID=2712863 RepID=UPI0013EC0267|nr:histidinol-phosphate transaminase [Thioalkalivibrio sp. XN8]NGP54266.1 histidinol-phosphate transaminase [Thioalkalivibrio sp. XN8]
MSATLHLLRPDLRDFTAYHAASPRRGVVRLHANESSWRSDWDATDDGLNRYPDPQPEALIHALAGLYGVAPGTVLVTRGSDDAIDLLVRAFCVAGEDAVLVCPPTFGMYAVAARLQGAGVVEVPLGQNFSLAVDDVLAAARRGVKLVFLCSPNNPTGSLVPARAVDNICRALHGHAVVVVDEAYVEFSRQPGFADRLERHGNLVLLRTLSKAWGLAGARVGALLAEPELVAILRALAPPYPLPSLATEAALRRLQPRELAAARRRTAAVVRRREALAEQLRALPAVRRVWPSEGNFLLARFADAAATMAACEAAGVLVRDFSRQPGLAGCLRITVGTAAENRQLQRALARLDGKKVRARG